MNISQLIASTERLKGRGYGAKNTFGYKKFGQIDFFNKVIRVKPSFSIIEVSMMIGAATEKNSLAHKAMVSIRGVEQELVTNNEKDLEGLVKRVAEEHKIKIPENEQEKAIFITDTLKRIEEKELGLKDKTIFKNSGGGYAIVSNEISKDCEIKVWCSCSSYYWVFQFYNVENGVDIWGKAPDKYIPKTKKGWEAFKSGKPMRNPGRNPGMCKHIMLLLALLMEEDVIAEARGITRSYKANIEKFNKKERLSEKEAEKLVSEFKKGRKAQYKERVAARTSPGYMGTEGWEKSDVFVDGKWVTKVKTDKKFNPFTGKFRWERGR